MTIAMLGCGEYGADAGPPDGGPPADAGVLDAGAGLRDAVLPAGPSSGTYTLAPTIGGYATFGASSTVGADGSVNVAGGVWNVPVPAEVGRSVGTITIPVRDNALVSGASGHESNVVSASLILHSSAQETTLAVAASSGTGVWQTLTLTATPHAIVPGESLVMRLSPQTTTTPPHFASVWSTVGISQVSYARLEHTLIIPPQLAQVSAGTPAFALSNTSFDSAAFSSLLYAIPCEVGDTLERYSIDLAGDGVVDATLQMVRYTAATGDQQLIATTQLTNIPTHASSGFAFTTYTVDSPDQVVGPGEFYLIWASATGGTGGINMFYGAARVAYTR